MKKFYLQVVVIIMVSGFASLVFAANALYPTSSGSDNYEAIKVDTDTSDSFSRSVIARKLVKEGSFGITVTTFWTGSGDAIPTLQFYVPFYSSWVDFDYTFSNGEVLVLQCGAGIQWRIGYKADSVDASTTGYAGILW